ncbi:MAG: folylpolyglutamate synthase/dihydrofolate synthase family protein [Actinomycetaceae bacterium]|nr:folylpolyglutamate synthase/dihydrofolate synthase family protein [Actinomycetaceae bacterium]
MTTQPDEGAGIDPDLLAYLEADDDPLALTDVTDTDPDLAEALAHVVSSSLLQGPLAEAIVDDPEESVDPLDAAATQVVARARMDQIYRSIIARAPEHRVQPSLERVEAVLEWMGHPERTYRSVHIAGTNGKTSTARIVDSLAREGGLRLGRFTSPHLVSPTERICLDGDPVSPEQFCAAWDDVAPFIELVDRKNAEEGRPRLSFFECFTVMAYQAFADAPVDLAVVEVGMGGRWDATNVITPAVAVITPIGYDHERWLGTTLEDIAREKAGIIPEGGVVICGRQAPQALAIIEEEARAKRATLRVLGRDFDVCALEKAVGGSLVSIRTPAARYDDVYVPLLGAHQADNAACALAAYEVVCGGSALAGDLVERGLMGATSPGRAEVVRSSPTIIVDAAHNPAGAEALRLTLNESFTLSHIVGVFAAMADKNIEAVLGEMEPVLDAVVVTSMDSERAADLDEVVRIAEEVFGSDRVSSADTLEEAIDEAVSQAESTPDPTASSGIVCFGSVHFAGDVLALLGKIPGSERTMP